MADKTTKKFTPIDTNVSKEGVVSLATRPNQPSSYGEGNLSATDLKKRFDRLANRIIGEYNNLIELFNSDEILGYLKAHSGSLKSALEQITNTDGDLITKNPADQKGENEVLNTRILAFYNAIVELQAFTEVKDTKHQDKTLSGVYETIANVKQFNAENAEAHKALTDLITTLQEFLGLNEHEGDSPLDGVIKEHISDHNDPESLAHGDIRQSVEEAQTNANKYAETVVSEHNVSVESHSDIRQDVINAETNAKGYADGILREHNNNAEAHKSIRDSVTAVSGDLSSHKTANDSHNDIRLLVKELSDRVNALHDTDDTTLDQTKEIVAYIKANRALIESITTSKVNVDDIIANLTTNVNNKPLAASQGVALKALIDALSEKAVTKDEFGNVTISGDIYATTIDMGGSTAISVEGISTPEIEVENGVSAGWIASSEAYFGEDDNVYISPSGSIGLAENTRIIANGGSELISQDGDFYLNGAIRTEDGLTICQDYILAPSIVVGENDEIQITPNEIALGENVSLTMHGESVATKSYVDNAIDNIEISGGGASIDEKHIELGNQVSAKGDYSAAFGKGFVATENDVFLIGNIGDYLQENPIKITKVGELLEDTDNSGAIVISTTNTITVENSTFGSLIDEFFQGERNFLLELDNSTRLPIIYAKKIKGGILGLSTIGVQIAVHNSYSCNDAQNKTITNAYVGFAGGENSAVFNQYNISLGEAAFSSGSGNASIADYSHSQNLDNKVSGPAGSAAGSKTEAGATAFSTGHKTKALGESSLTFGIRSETKYTESTESIEKEGGKGSIAGGYNTRANVRYSQAFGVNTHSDAEGQLVCGKANATDTNALFIVGQGSSTNALAVKTNGDGYFKGNIYTNGVKVATLNDIPVIPDIPENSCPISEGTGTGAAQMGYNSSANANYSFAGGEVASTKGGVRACFAFGINTKAQADAAAALGDRTVANANYSLAGGETSTTAADAKACLAFGISAEARKNATAAFGWRTVANRECETVVGMCNNFENWTNALFVVGNGTSDSDRRNAFVVNGNGDVYITGNAYSGGKLLGERVFCVNITITFSYTVGNAPFDISAAFSYFSKNADINRTTLDGFVTDFMNSFSLGSQVYIPATVFIGAGVYDIRDNPGAYSITTGLVSMPGRWDAIQQPNFFYTSEEGTKKFTPESLRAELNAKGLTLTTTIRARVT